ncbi:MAG: OmpH family outer membrane protein [Deltaproteobacteria bacterium]|jgi:Skp family chaperone for outer membrane proteins|nr:OmpH family outer membrane protein [Deltaproteobacteria bacterium]
MPKTPKKSLKALISILSCLIVSLALSGTILAQGGSSSKSSGDTAQRSQGSGSSDINLVPGPGGGKGLTIAVIDMTKAIDDSNEGKSLQNKFKSEFDKTKGKLDEKGRSLETRANDFGRKQATMAEAERDKTRNALEKEIEAYQNETQKASDDFKAAVGKAMTPLLTRAEKLIQDISKENKYLAVVENGSQNAVIYMDPSITAVDITGDVTKALNSKRK